MTAITPNLRVVHCADDIPGPRDAHGSTRSISSLVLSSLDDDKAEDAVVIDLAGKTTFADAMIVASGRSARHVAAMAEHLVERLKAAGQRSIHVEGLPQADWVLIDAGEAIVHLFRPEVRSFYNLEKMWGDEFPAMASRPSPIQDVYVNA